RRQGLDRKGELRARGLRQPDRTGADLEQHATREEGGVVDLGLPEHALHLGAGLLPAPPLVAARDLVLTDQLEPVGREQRAAADVGVPLLDPEAQLLVRVAALMP